MWHPDCKSTWHKGHQPDRSPISLSQPFLLPSDCQLPRVGLHSFPCWMELLHFIDNAFKTKKHPNLIIDYSNIAYRVFNFFKKKMWRSFHQKQFCIIFKSFIEAMLFSLDNFTKKLGQGVWKRLCWGEPLMWPVFNFWVAYVRLLGCHIRPSCNTSVSFVMDWSRSLEWHPSSASFCFIFFNFV